MNRPELAAAADELYGLPPEQFTAARDERAKQARSGGDRDLAAELRKLPRPTKTASLVNLLVRRQPDEVEQLLTLGEALREATETLAGAELRRLGRQRQQVIYGLVQQVRRMVEQPVTDTTQRELENTLEAALADAGAADAVRSGRLVRALTPNGLDPVDVAGAVAAPGLGARPGPSGAGRRATAGTRSSRSASEARSASGASAARPAGPDPARLAAARKALSEAEDAAGRTALEVRDADRAATAAQEAEARAAEQVRELEQQLAQARTAREEAAGTARQRARERDAAARADRTAQSVLAKARAALERLSHG